MDRLSEGFDLLFTAVFSEVFAVSFLIGFAIFLVGFLLIGLFVITRMLGNRTTGTVVGAVKNRWIRRKQKDGKDVEKVKTSLYPVYEYTASDGSQRRMRGSEGGSMTLKYTTGQTVNLIVREDDDYDDVYDADERGALYLGLGFSGFGIALMTWIGSAIAAFGMGVTSIFLALLGFLVRGLIKKFDKSTGTTQNSTLKNRLPYSKAFEAAELHPIEHFQN